MGIVERLDQEAHCRRGTMTGALHRDAKAEIERLREEILMLCAWREPVEVCAPELGGLVTAMMRAEHVARAAPALTPTPKGER